METKQSHKYLLNNPEPKAKSLAEIKETVLNYDVEKLNHLQKDKVIWQLQHCLKLDNELIKELEDEIEELKEQVLRIQNGISAY